MTDDITAQMDETCTNDPLAEIDQVGDARERKLRQVGVVNAADLAEADPARLDDATTIPTHKVVEIVENARAYVGLDEPVEYDADGAGEAWEAPSGFADAAVLDGQDASSTGTTTDSDTSNTMSSNTAEADQTHSDASALADAIDGGSPDTDGEVTADEVDDLILMAGLGAFDDGEYGDLSTEQMARHVQERIVEAGVDPERLLVPADGIGAPAIKAYANYSASEGLEIPPATVFTAGADGEEVQYPSKADYNKRDMRMIEEADGLVVLANGPLVGKFISECADRDLFIDAPER